MADFKAQLGRADHPGLASQAERLERIVPGRNPYVTGHSLPPDSPVFFGRKRELAAILGVLRRPDKPGNVSVLGEGRFGKSSFLNQVYQALAAEPGLVSIYATAQDWTNATPGRFFGGLHLAIQKAIATGSTAPGVSADHPTTEGGLAHRSGHTQSSRRARYMTEETRKIWSEKLAFLLAEEAKLSDFDQKFNVAQRIREARNKLAELDGPVLDGPNDPPSGVIEDPPSGQPCTAGRNDDQGPEGGGSKPPAAAVDYPGLRDALLNLDGQGMRYVLLLDEFEALAYRGAFDADFFSNLRALGDGHEYRFGYLIASRRPLKELCQDRSIAASKFWNIFGLPYYMGLFDEDQARALVGEPLKRSLPKGHQSDLDIFWTRELAPLAGCHPALIQLVMAEHWDACALGNASHRERIDHGLRDFLEELWTSRHGKEEWRVLIEAADGLKFPAFPGEVSEGRGVTLGGFSRGLARSSQTLRKLPTPNTWLWPTFRTRKLQGANLIPDHVLRDLRLRGLITAEGRPLCDAFARLIPELMPDGLTMEKALARFKKGGEAANSVLDILEHWAKTGGRLYRALKGDLAESEEKRS